MDVYNTLIVNSKCFNCKQETQIKIQFRYGDTWDYEYKIGERMRWDGNNVGKEDVRKVVLDGVAEPCKKCNIAVDYLIFIINNEIKSFEKNNGQYNFYSTDDYYLIIE